MGRWVPGEQTILLDSLPLSSLCFGPFNSCVFMFFNYDGTFTLTFTFALFEDILRLLSVYQPLYVIGLL